MELEQQSLDPAPDLKPDAVQPVAFDELLRRAREEQQQRTLQQAQLTTVSNAVTGNANIAGQAAELSRQLNIPQAVIETDLPRYQEQAKINHNTALVAKNPVLARWVAANPDSARTAQDEYGVLNDLSGFAKYLVSAPDAPRGGLLKDALQFGRQAVAGAFGLFAQGAYGVAAAPFELVGLDSIGGKFRGLSEDAKREMNYWGGTNPNAGFVEQSVMSGAQSVGLNMALLPAGVAASTSKLMLGLMGLVTGGISYVKGRDEGLSPAQAIPYAVEDAAAEIITEKFRGAAGFLKNIKAGSSAGKLFMYEVTREVPGEIAATLWQNFNEWTNINQDKSVVDFLSEQPKEVLGTVISTMVGGTTQIGTVRTLDKVTGLLTNPEDRSAALHAQQQAELLQKILKTAEASVLRERDPQSFEAFMQEATDEGAQNLYIDAQVLQQSGVSMEEMAALMPSLAPQIAESLAAGTPMVIPTAQFATVMPGEQMAEALIEHARLSPDGMSRAEAKQYMAEEGDRIMGEVERVLGASAGEQQFTTARDEIKAGFLQQLNAMGRQTSQVNDAYATLLANFYAINATRAGMTPQQMLQRYQLGMQSQELSGAIDQDTRQVQVDGQWKPIANSNGQLIHPTVQGQRNFWKWFGGSKVTDEKGAPLVVYHGRRRVVIAGDLPMPDGITTFEPGRGERGIGRAEREANVPGSVMTDGIWFASAGEASEYAGGETEAAEEASVYPVYLSIKNPKLLSWADARDTTVEELRAQGYDGVRIAENNNYVAFNPEQIKSATGNDGSFDAGDASVLSQSATIRSGKETLKRFGLNPGKKYNTREVAAALEARQRAKYGEIARGDRSAEAATKIAKWMVAEVEFEMLHPEKSVVGWYSAKFQRALDTFGEEFPELKTDQDARDLFTALIAITSDGQKVVPNFAMAADLYGNYRSTGKFTTDRGHARQASIDGNVAVIQRMLDELGPAKMREYLMAEDTVSSLRKEAKAEGIEFSTDYQAHIKLPRAALVFGPKLGAFYANLMGAHGYLTMDRWWSRTFNRYRGQLLMAPTRDGLDRFKQLLGRPEMSDDEVLAAVVEPRNAYEAKGFKNGTEIEKAANTIYKAAFENLEDTPFNATDRTFMLDAVDKAAKMLSRKGAPMSVADIQAVLWYYEKRLYGELGARQTADISYEEAARKVIADRARADQPGGQDLPGREGAVRQAGSEGNDGASGTEVGLEAFEENSALEQSAFHGSPTRGIRQFSTDFIGTGEGAQAFGWGLYLAELRDIAAGYAKNLANRNISNQGRLNAHANAQRLAALAGDPKYAADDIRFALENEPDHPQKELLSETLRMLESGDYARPLENQGSLYQVEVPDDVVARMLLWDKPLSEQPASVLDALKRSGSKFAEAAARVAAGERARDVATKYGMNPLDLMVGTGGAMYESLASEQGSPRKASEFLDSLGVPGIKYLDGGSRTDKDGSFNFVVFDGKNITVTHEDGSPVTQAERNELLQDALNKDPARGQLKANWADITAGPSIITLLEGADLSTFIHESGHFFLEVQVDLAARIQQRIDSGQDVTDGEREILDDTNRLLKWFGLKDEQGDPMLAQWRRMSLEQKRDSHEKFARGFETYAMEGRAPSLELQSMFQRFRAWMLSIYKHLRSLNSPLTDEVRGVMDRMLATGDQIAEAEAARKMGALFKSAADGGMTFEEFTQYHDLAVGATQQAIEALQAKSIGDMKWLANAHSKALRAAQKEAAAQRKTVEDEVTAEVNDLPEVRAQAALDALQVSPDFTAAMQDWQARRDEAAQQAEEAVKAETLAANPEATGLKKGQLLAKTKRERANEVDHRMLEWEKANQKPTKQANATEADMMMVADSFGFSSADEMLQRIQAMGSKADLIQAMTDQRVLERFGDLGSPEAVAAAADRAVHNAARVRFLARELSALQDANDVRADVGEKKVNGKTRRVTVDVMAQAAKQTAETIINRLKIREIRPSLYSAAGARAARAAERAMKKGDVAAAAQEKRNQIIQVQAAKAAYDAREEIDKGLRYFGKFDSDGTRKSLASDYLEQIDALLSKYDFKRSGERKASLRTWVQSRLNAGEIPEIAESLLSPQERQAYLAEVQSRGEDGELIYADDEERIKLLADAIDRSAQRPYRELSMEEFRGLVDTIKNIEHLGRLKNLLLTQRDNRTYEQARDEIAAGIVENATAEGKNTRTPADWLGQKLQAIRQFGVAHIKVATWARIMDGGKDDGPVWRYFVRTANERASKETTMRAQATEKLDAILRPVLSKVSIIDKAGQGKLFPTVGKSLNWQQRFAIALNVGNESNLQRLLDGDGWTFAQIRPVLESLTSQELKAVQAVWDHFESYRQQIAEKERRVSGKEPDWIAPRPITIRSADGQAITLRGGYYPVVFDPKPNMKAGQHSAQEEAKNLLRAAGNVATTRRSFTKSRVEEVKGRPLLLNLQGLYSGVNDVIHDLSWHEWVIDINKLLRSKQIDEAMREHYGPEIKREFEKWRDDIVAGSRRLDHQIERAASFLRQGVSAAALTFNVVSAAMQPLGIFNSVGRVGKVWLAKGVAKYVASPIGATREAQAKSEWLSNRTRTRFRELNELRNQIQGQTAAKELMGRYGYWLMARTQLMVDVPTWWGAYEKAIAAGHDEDTSVALADQAVKDTQGGGEEVDQSGIERGGPMIKLFTAFYGFMGTTLNASFMEGKTNKSTAKAAVNILLMLSAPAILGSLLKSALVPGDDDDDDLVKKLAAEQISFLFGLVAFGREFAQLGKVFLDQDKGMGYSGPAGLRLIPDAIKLAQQANQGEFDDAFRKAFINVLGDLTGLPSVQINRSITGTQALMEGRTENPAAVLLGYEEPR